MNKIKHSIVWAILIWFTTSAAAGAHVHGQAYMDVVLVDNDLTVHVTLAASDVVGFEGSPNNEDQKQRIETALKQLTAEKNWLSISKGQCVNEEVVLVNPFDSKADQNGHGSHQDFEVSLKYSCQKPEEIMELQIKLADLFPHIHDIDVQWLAHNKQGFQKLHGKEKTVNLER